MTSVSASITTCSLMWSFFVDMLLIRMSNHLLLVFRLKPVLSAITSIP